MAYVPAPGTPALTRASLRVRRRSEWRMDISRSQSVGSFSVKFTSRFNFTRGGSAVDQVAHDIVMKLCRSPPENTQSMAHGDGSAFVVVQFATQKEADEFTLRHSEFQRIKAAEQLQHAAAKQLQHAAAEQLQHAAAEQLQHSAAAEQLQHAAAQQLQHSASAEQLQHAAA